MAYRYGVGMVTTDTYGSSVGAAASKYDQTGSMLTLGVVPYATYSGLVADISGIPTFQPYHYIKY